MVQAPFCGNQVRAVEKAGTFPAEGAKVSQRSQSKADADFSGMTKKRVGEQDDEVSGTF
jgi:hypothetical protein